MHYWDNKSSRVSRKQIVFICVCQIAHKVKRSKHRGDENLSANAATNWAANKTRGAVHTEHCIIRPVCVCGGLHDINPNDKQPEKKVNHWSDGAAPSPGPESKRWTWCQSVASGTLDIHPSTARAWYTHLSLCELTDFGFPVNWFWISLIFSHKPTKTQTATWNEYNSTWCPLTPQASILQLFCPIVWFYLQMWQSATSDSANFTHSWSK